MDDFVDARIERVQKALTNLIDSLGKNNPSPALAREFYAADQELQHALAQLQRHQNNWARIEALRLETAENDGKIKSVLSDLWAMRKEIKAVPTTTYTRSAPVAPFTVDDILAFARRIAPHSRPPPGVENGIPSGTASTPMAATTMENIDSAMGGAQTPTPGSSFNTGLGTSTAPTPTASGDSQAGADPASQATSSSAATALPEHLRPAVNINAGQIWVPWPTDDRIRNGALAVYQNIVNQGIDPLGYDPAEEERRRKEEEQRQKDAEERQRLEREENERRMRQERERIMRERERERENDLRRGSVTDAGPSKGPEKKQFQFMGGLDDDEDD